MSTMSIKPKAEFEVNINNETNDIKIMKFNFTNDVNIKFVGELQNVKNVAYVGSEFEEITFDNEYNGNYDVYNVENGLLIKKSSDDKMVIKNISNVLFKFHDYIYVDNDYKVGFFDFDKLNKLRKLNDIIFDEEECDYSMFEFKNLNASDIKTGHQIKMSNLDLEFEIKKKEKDVLGYIIDSDCGTAFPLQLLINEENNAALILTGKLMEELLLCA